MAIKVPSWTGTYPVDVIPDSDGKQQGNFYPVKLLQVVEAWAHVEGIRSADFDELVELWYEFGDEQRLLEEGIIAQEEAYFASYCELGTAD